MPQGRHVVVEDRERCNPRGVAHESAGGGRPPGHKPNRSNLNLFQGSSMLFISTWELFLRKDREENRMRLRERIGRQASHLVGNLPEPERHGIVTLQDGFRQGPFRPLVPAGSKNPYG